MRISYCSGQWPLTWTSYLTCFSHRTSHHLSVRKYLLRTVIAVSFITIRYFDNRTFRYSSVMQRSLRVARVPSPSSWPTLPKEVFTVGLGNSGPIKTCPTGIVRLLTHIPSLEMLTNCSNFKWAKPILPDNELKVMNCYRRHNCITRSLELGLWIMSSIGIVFIAHHILSHFRSSGFISSL